MSKQFAAAAVIVREIRASNGLDDAKLVSEAFIKLLSQRSTRFDHIDVEKFRKICGFNIDEV